MAPPNPVGAVRRPPIRPPRVPEAARWLGGTAAGRTPTAISRPSAASGILNFFQPVSRIRRQCQLDHSQSVNLELSSSDHGPFQESPSAPIAAALGRAVFKEVNVFRVNGDWPPRRSSAGQRQRWKVVPIGGTGRRDRADRSGVSTSAVPVGTVLAEVSGSTCTDRLTHPQRARVPRRLDCARTHHQGRSVVRYASPPLHGSWFVTRVSTCYDLNACQVRRRLRQT